MKKNIVIVLLIITTTLSLMYGFVQKAEADKQRALAEANAQVARMQQAEAEQQRKIVEEQTAKLSITLEELQTRLESEKGK